MTTITRSHVRLTAGDGHAFSAFVARPTGPVRGGLVVVQEIFGVNAHIRSVAEGYAERGFLAVAPALFDRIEPGLELGYSEADIQRGIGLKGRSPNEKALLDIAAAIAHASAGGKVGIVGYCWGGLLSWLSACKLDGLSAAVCYYGGGMPDQKDLTPSCPVLAHFGERDHAIPVAGVEAFRAARPEVEVHLYPAGHGFNCDQRGSFDAPSAQLAFQRSLDFLSRHLA